MSQESMNPASPSEKPRWLGYVQLALIVIAIAVALYFAQAPNRVERGPVSGAVQAMPVVSVVKPAATEHVIKVNLTGSVRAERRAKVRSEVVGRVVWVSPDFTEGGTIPANEPFLKIDRREFELEVEAANMAVSEAEAKVGVERALPLDRAGRLPSIAVAEAALGKARAALALAELRLARTEISLPFDARVVSTDVEVGEMVGPASTAGRSSRLGVVYRRGVLKVRAPIEPGDLSRLEPAIGRSALVRTNSGTYEAKVTGTSSVVAATLNPRRARSDSARPRLLPLRAARARATASTSSSIVTVVRMTAPSHHCIRLSIGTGAGDRRSPHRPPRERVPCARYSRLRCGIRTAPDRRIVPERP